MGVYLVDHISIPSEFLYLASLQNKYLIVLISEPEVILGHYDHVPILLFISQYFLKSLSNFHTQA